MNHQWRKIDSINYLMRDGKSTKELRELYQRILIKYPGTKLKKTGMRIVKHTMPHTMPRKLFLVNLYN